MRTLVFLFLTGLSAAQVPASAQLEAQLARLPEDIEVRSKLVRQYFLASRRDPNAEQARVRHVLWLAANRPDSEILGEPSATLEDSSKNYVTVKNAWLAQIENAGVTGVVLSNAANFFRPSEPARSVELLLKARSIEPANPLWTRQLGELYAFQLTGIRGLNQNGYPVQVDPAAARRAEIQTLQAQLLAVNDAQLLGAIASGLAGRGLIAASMTGRRDEVVAVTDRFIQRAQQLDPKNATWHAMLAHSYAERGEASTGGNRAEYMRRAFAEFESARSLDPSSVQDPEYARTAIETGDLAKARGWAEACLAHVPQLEYKDQSVHECNLILGRVALRQGDLKRAEAHLAAAADVDGKGALSSFGPNMALARELLEKGERQAVLDYFRRCAKFWTHDRGQLARWTTEVNAGKIPEFGANLIY